MSWNPQLISSFASLPIGIALAAASYLFAKRKEREAEWRSKKIAYYQDLIAAISGLAQTTDQIAANRAFAAACNNLNLFAPPTVLSALYEFREATRTVIPLDEHDALLSRLLVEIRKDVGVKTDPNLFRFQLWTAAQN